MQQTKDYVCVKENGELIKPDHLTKRFQELSTEKNLRKIRLHDLRHYENKETSIGVINNAIGVTST